MYVCEMRSGFINMRVSLNVCVTHTVHTSVPETLHEESLSDGDEGICHRSAVFLTSHTHTSHPSAVKL